MRSRGGCDLRESGRIRTFNNDEHWIASVTVGPTANASQASAAD